jgi:hypothetical protein
VITKCLGICSVAHRLAPLAFGMRNCRCLKGISWNLRLYSQQSSAPL